MIDNQTLLLIVLAAIWTIPWKAWALWLAARRTEKWWFLILVIINTFAILEIIYIFFVAKRQDHFSPQPESDEPVATSGDSE